MISDDPVALDDTAPVRAEEQLDWQRVAQYLRERLPACEVAGLDIAAPMAVAQFPGGHSNLTYEIRFGDVDLVLRRAPFGPVAPSAHDMAREYRWLRALHPVFPLAPKAYLWCDDPEPAGSAFYVMERRRGHVLRHSEPRELAGNLEARRAASSAVIDCLATLHAIDAGAHPFNELGRPAGFVSRQVRGWTSRWQRAQTESCPAVDDVARWLGERIPPDPGTPAILHGDFKLDNLMLAFGNPSQVVAVFDWELCAVGDRLVDLGLLLTYWTMSTDAGDAPDALSSVTHREGWLPRDALIERYAAHGNDVNGIGYYEVLARFKLAVVLQQIYQRYRTGQTTDPRFARLDERVAQLARDAANYASRL
ncbi:MAG: phosphotransferase family protein [Vicinamibacterales bacterium]